GEAIVGDASGSGYTLAAGFWGAQDEPASTIVNSVPTVVLTSPTSGSFFAIGAPITLSAVANAVSGKSISSVEFLDGSNHVSLVADPPFTITLSNLSPGVHIFSAKATDSGGASAISSPATIEVSGTISNAPGDLAFSFDPGSSVHGGVLPVLGIGPQPDGKMV